MQEFSVVPALQDDRTTGLMLKEQHGTGCMGILQNGMKYRSFVSGDCDHGLEGEKKVVRRIMIAHLITAQNGRGRSDQRKRSQLAAKEMNRVLIKLIYNRKPLGPKQQRQRQQKQHQNAKKY